MYLAAKAYSENECGKSKPTSGIPVDRFQISTNDSIESVSRLIKCTAVYMTLVLQV